MPTPPTLNGGSAHDLINYEVGKNFFGSGHEFITEECSREPCSSSSYKYLLLLYYYIFATVILVQSPIVSISYLFFIFQLFPSILSSHLCSNLNIISYLLLLLFIFYDSRNEKYNFFVIIILLFEKLKVTPFDKINYAHVVLTTW